MTTTPPSRISGNASTADVVGLDDPAATDARLVGGKAAALAQARAAGIDTVPGEVLTTSFCRAVDEGGEIAGHPALVEVATRLGETRLVARSSSIVEDTSTSSAAGQFESVIGIDSVDDLADAVRRVLDSRRRAGASDHPIAVLVQPMVEPEVAGVLFGVDPVTGRSDRRVVTAVEGQPGRLVSGEVDGSWYLLDRSGDVVDSDRRDGPKLPSRLLTRLVRLSDAAETVFGTVQDIEWARSGDRLLLLQSRPVTTEVRGVPAGPVYGPGPVAETFPERLSPLEAEMWVPPLRGAVEEALRMAGAASESDLHGPDLVVAVDGYVAIDLERTGEIRHHERRPPWFAVATRVRRLRSAWRVGRLRSALPALADRLIERVDGDLESIPSTRRLTDRQLVALIGRGRTALRAVHAHEVLMGLLIGRGEGRLTGASVAMRVLAEARSDGSTDAEIVRHSPIVLALTPPRIAATTELPGPCSTPDLMPGSGTEPEPARPNGTASADILREALRLRARWLQELMAKAAWELGERLAKSGRIESVEDIRFLPYEELALVVTRRTVVDKAALRGRREAFAGDAPRPLPARFQISDRGRPITVRDRGETGGGTGAGGGRGRGPVTHDTDDPPAGSVLVVQNLSPGIGPLLTRLEGVVAETGSVLAHLAILARESGVATVVGHVGAVEEFPEGTTIDVDGDTGQVRVVDPTDGGDTA